MGDRVLSNPFLFAQELLNSSSFRMLDPLLGISMACLATLPHPPFFVFFLGEEEVGRHRSPDDLKKKTAIKAPPKYAENYAEYFTVQHLLSIHLFRLRASL